jgi:hypothetical protein
VISRCSGAEAGRLPVDAAGTVETADTAGDCDVTSQRQEIARKL